MIDRLLLSLALSLSAGSSLAMAAEKLPVVASFSILGDIAGNVGGDRVAVSVLVGPDGDAHVYEPTPDDARRVHDGRLLVVNGLGFEGWMERLAEASGYAGPVVVASDGVKPRQMVEEEGGTPEEITDPHAWQNLGNAPIYVNNIEAALIAVDPDGRASYTANAERYLRELAALDGEVKATIASIPPTRRKIITSHDAFGYFGAAYGLALIAPEGVSTETEASAADVAKIIRQIKTEAIPAVFMENISDPRLMAQIAGETHTVIGGALYSDALSPADGPAGTYVAMFRSNMATLKAALAPQ
jgi:zinc/manganese transport system substrate-binding protein